MNHVYERIPHRPPFLFLDEIVEETEESLKARRRVPEDEFWTAGHYPGNPIMPGVLICEAVFQAGAAFLGRKAAGTGEDLSGHVPVLTRIRDVRFRNIVRPGDELLIEVKLTERLGKFFFMRGSVQTADRKILTVDFGVALVEAAETDGTEPAP